MSEKKVGSNRMLWIMIVSIAVLGLAYAFRLQGPVAVPPELQGVARPEPRSLGPFSLIDQGERLFNLESFSDTWSFVFFGYTYCPDICPMTLATLVGVGNQLGKKSEQPKDYQVVFISVDPERDTPKTLSSYMEFFDKQFIGVTGNKEQIDGVAQQFGAGYLKVPGTSPDTYLISHTSSIFLIDPRGRLVASFSPPHDPATIAGQYHKIRNLY
ncbi:MAG: SCO family protein [Gammaproteobacteria bacterium]|nr:SCO family protein [Gammaproteobacteria bacterium]